MEVWRSQIALLVAVAAASPALGSELYFKSEAKHTGATRVYDWSGFYHGSEVRLTRILH